MQYLKDRILPPLIIALVIALAGLIARQINPDAVIRLLGGVSKKEFDEFREKALLRDTKIVIISNTDIADGLRKSTITKVRDGNGLETHQVNFNGEPEQVWRILSVHD